jgi:CheY-like chemotaxis protein
MARRAPSSTSGKQSKTILVVDDNPLIRRAVCHELVSSGFEPCIEAENGAHALSVAAKVKPHLVILDLSMPIMNGLEVAPVLRRMLPATPIILYTLHGFNLPKETFLAFGVNDVISKEEPLQNLISRAYDFLQGD